MVFPGFYDTFLECPGISRLTPDLDDHQMAWVRLPVIAATRYYQAVKSQTFRLKILIVEPENHK